jgi:hypothetical protein
LSAPAGRQECALYSLDLPLDHDRKRSKLKKLLADAVLDNAMLKQIAVEANASAVICQGPIAASQ